MRMILTRHGKTAWNLKDMTQGTADIALHETGIRQAQLLGERIGREEKVDHIYTSPLQRAVMTGEIIRKTAGLCCPVQPDPRLIEVHYGAWEGLRYSEITQRYPESIREWEADPYHCKIPGAESMIAVEQRCRDFFEEMCRKHPKDTLLIVGHAVTCKFIIAAAIGLPPENIHALAIGNTTMSVVEVQENRTTLQLLNDMSHVRMREENG